MNKLNIISWDITSDSIFDDEGYESQGEDYVMIDLVYVVPEERGKGIARKMMADEIAKIKKEHPGLTIKLSALPKDDGIDQERLVSFYESIGFMVDDIQETAGVIMSM